MNHRHLQIPSGTPVEELPSAAIVDLLERGDLGDWRPIADAIRRDPYGNLADRVLFLVDAYPMYGTSPLWRSWIHRCRDRAQAESPPLLSIPELRRQLGITQVELAQRLGMSQSDLSKLERRGDVRLSSLQRYAEGLGGRLRVLFLLGDTPAEILVAEDERKCGSQVRPVGASQQHGPPDR